MARGQEYVRQDFWDDHGVEGMVPDLARDPSTLQPMFDIKRVVKNPRRADCLGQPRLDMVHITAWATWIGDLQTDPPIPNFVAVEVPVRMAHLVRYIGTEGEAANAEFRPPQPGPGVVSGPWGPYIAEISDSGMRPTGALPSFGLDLDPSLSRPWARMNQRPESDFVLHLWGGVRLQDLPALPAIPLANPVLRVHWNCYARYGWYFDELAVRPKRCHPSVIAGAEPTWGCQDTAPKLPEAEACCDECAAEGGSR